MEEPQKVSLTDKEMIFAESYLVCLNKAEAARQAKCPKKAAREQGYEVYNRAHVKAYIEAKLKERVLSSEETVKLVSDTAQASITDYFKPVKKLQTTQKIVGLQEVIDTQRKYLEREYLFMERKGLTEQARDNFVERLENVEDMILRMEIELEMDPSATRVIDNDPVFVDVMELDINMLVADKEKGKVKKIKYSKEGGLEVEMYSAIDAQEKLMKMHGKYEKDNEQSKPVAQVTIFQLPDNGR
jgi:phage terminase small subunit